MPIIKDQLTDFATGIAYGNETHFWVIVGIERKRNLPIERTTGAGEERGEDRGKVRVVSVPNGPLLPIVNMSVYLHSVR